MEQGGSPYGAPPPEPILIRGAGVGIPGPDHLPAAEPASPISVRHPAGADFVEPAPAAQGNFPDEDFSERGAVAGNRWPRQETLALLKVRSDMDAVFRDATLKGPLWEDVSRKLAELGYRRSAKKCKEKFENVHKYYKRTKEGRAGRQDGKSYRFFDQLEALHGTTTTTTTTISAPIPVMRTTIPAPNPSPSLLGNTIMAEPGPTQTGAPPVPVAPAPAAGISFSSDTFSSSGSESEGDEECGEGRKRKRGGSGGGVGRKMMAFFDGMMRMVMERQDAMQQRFLEAIERREQDRMVREEAWRRQEMARLAREHELLAQERATAASRDSAIIAFLQKITGQTVQVPLPQATTVLTPSPLPPPPKPPQLQPQQQQQAQAQQPQQQQQKQPQAQPQPQPQPQQPITAEVAIHHHPPSSSEIVLVPEQQEVAVGSSSEPASSRWPKVEVHALINIRSNLDSKYQEAGPKGPLWEEISSEMRLLGYNRSSKRCKEKWENINKYFKKVKESSKKRPEDAKTCPYFHQLDALYRHKLVLTQRQQTQPNPLPIPNIQQERSTEGLAIMAAPQVHQSTTETGNKNNVNVDGGRPNNGGTSDSGATMKPEDIVMELINQPWRPEDSKDDCDKLDEAGIDDDDDDDDDGEDDDGDQYRVQFKNQDASPAPATTGSFLGMTHQIETPNSNSSLPIL